MITIVSKQDGFRRAGMAHPFGAHKYQDDFFTEEQIAILEQEPMLIVKRPIDLILTPHALAQVEAMDRAFAMAISCLDPDKKNKTDWTGSGIPQVSALTEIMGEDISAAMRDTAYKVHLDKGEGE